MLVKLSRSRGDWSDADFGRLELVAEAGSPCYAAEVVWIKVGRTAGVARPDRGGRRSFYGGSV